jgi:hypothetical protein
MERLGPPTAIGLGRIATVSTAPEGPPGQLLGYAIKEGTGQLTPGTIGHVALVGRRVLERKCATNRYTAVRAGPTRER